MIESYLLWHRLPIMFLVKRLYLKYFMTVDVYKEKANIIYMESHQCPSSDYFRENGNS